MTCSHVVTIPGPRSILAEADVWYDAKDLDSDDQQELPDRMFNHADATIGSSTGVDTSDPLRLSFSGERYVTIPSTENNYIEASGFSAAGTEFVVTLDADTPEWDTATVNRYVRVHDGANRMILLAISGNLRLYGGSEFITSSGHPSSGRVQWRLSINVSTGAAEIAWRTDGVTDPGVGGWTVSASDTITDYVVVNDIIRLGGTGDGAGNIEKYYSLSAYKDGTVFGSWVADDGQSTNDGFTVSRSTTGYHTTVVDRPILTSDGVDDVLAMPVTTLPSHVTPSTGDFTLLVISRTWPNGGVTRALWGEGNGAFEGLALYESSGTTLISTARDSGSGQVTAGLAGEGSDGVLKGKALVTNGGRIRTVTSAQSTAFQDTSGLSDINHGTQPMLMSSSGTGLSVPREGEYLAVVQWNRTLTVPEVQTVADYLVAGDYP